MLQLFFSIANFFILVTILTKVLKRPAKAFFAERHTKIANEIETMQVREREARDRHWKVKRHFGNLEQEVEKMKGAIHRTATYEREQLQARADQLLRRLEEESKRQIAQEEKKTAEQLRLRALKRAFDHVATALQSGLPLEQRRTITSSSMQSLRQARSFGKATSSLQVEGGR